MYQKLADDKHSFRWSVPFGDAIAMELHRKSLSWHLTDIAEKDAVSAMGSWFYEQDADTTITCDGKEFVVEFRWEGPLPEQPPVTDRQPAVDGAADAR